MLYASHRHIHALQKWIKMLQSNWRVTLFQCWFSLRFGLWTLVPRARAALFEYMQSVCVLENITFCSLFTNCLRPFRDFSHHTVTSNNHHLFPLLVGDMRCRCSSKQSLAVGACNDFCICSFKCFHTADMFAAICWQRTPLFDHDTSLFGTIYSVFSLIPKELFFFCYFQPNNLQCIQVWSNIFGWTVSLWVNDD